MSRRIHLSDKCQGCPLLKRVGLWELPEAEADAFCETTTLHVFRRGESIVCQGDRAEGMWVLRGGIASIHVNDDEGRAHTVRLALPGEVLGTCGSRKSQSYCYGATALQDRVYACHVPLTSEPAVLRQYPSVTSALFDAVGEELSTAYRKMHVLATRNAASRLALLLLELDRMQELHLSRQEMAEMIGVTTETLVRTLTNFRKDGLVETTGRAILIRDRERLEAIGQDRADEELLAPESQPPHAENA